MRKYFLWLLVVLFFFQCQSDNSVREEARAAAAAIAEQSTSGKPSAASNKSSIVPPEELAPGQTPPTVTAELVLSLGDAKAKKGESTCLTVKAAGFTDLIGLQFTIRWNPEEVSFEKIDNMKLANLSTTNFGLTQADKGVAAMSWINPSLTATSVAHQAPLFDVCFVASGTVGTRASVRFASRPTAFEVINVDEEILQFKGNEGVIVIE